ERREELVLQAALTFGFVTRLSRITQQALALERRFLVSGQVSADADHALNAAVGAANDETAFRDPDNSSIGAEQPVLRFVEALLERGGKRLLDWPYVVGVQHSRHPEFGAERALRKPERFLWIRRPRHPARRQLPFPRGEPGDGQGHPQTVFVFAHAL